MVKPAEKPTVETKRASVVADQAALPKQDADSPKLQSEENRYPPEGPHARPELINEAATPGTGLFSAHDAVEDEVDPGAG